MRSQNTFYFFITDSLGRSAYWENNIVKWQTTPRPLNFSPDGWMDTQPTFTRSSKYYGLNRQFTTPYKFVEDGAFILRYLLFTGKSYEETVYLNINKWNDLTDLYETYYKGEFDLIEILDDSPTGITVNLVEGGFAKLLNASDDTVYEITPDRDIFIEGIELFETARYAEIDTEINGSAGQAHALPMVFLEVEGETAGIEHQGQNFDEFSDGFFIRSADELTINIVGTMKYRLGPFCENYRLALIRVPAVGSISEIIAYEPASTAEGSHEIILDLQVTLNPGDALRYSVTAFFDVSIPNHHLIHVYYESWPITITYNNTLTSSICRAIRPLDLLRALILKITGNAAYTVSSALLTQYQHLYITSGDCIRQLEDAIIKTSFSDFFKAFDAILTAGFGISGLASVFEARSYFYNSSSVTLNLSEVADLQISLAADLLANTAKFGYANQSYEDLNGRLEFNTTAQWEFPVTKLKRAYEMISPYRADSYGIEFTRKNLEGKTTTDDSADNDVFIINVDEDQSEFITQQSIDYLGATQTFTFNGAAGDEALYNEKKHFVISNDNVLGFFTGNYTIASATVNGLNLDIVINETPNASTANFDADISFLPVVRRETYTTLLPANLPASTFNIEDLTPKRMLLKHGRWLRAMMYFFTLEKLNFLTLDKNKELSTTLAGVTITEKANVRVDTLGAPLFYPYIFSFKTRVPSTFMSLFKSAVNGHVQFSYNGFVLYGFPVNMSVKPGLNEAQEWKLLASPLCNLPDLVDLLANPLNNVNMATYGLSFSMLCPVQMVPQGVIEQDVYNFRHMDLWTFEEQSTRYSDYHPYGQKWQTSDNIHLQCISRNLGPVQVDVINRHGRVFGSYPLQQITTPAVANPYQLFQGDINLTVFNPGCYRLRCTAGIGAQVVVFLSEWLNLAEFWPKTLLFQYTNTRNQAATIFTVGYTPSYRIEGNIIDFAPRSRFSSYEDEPANQYLLEGVPYRQFTLFAGDSFGLPPWAIDKLNRIMTLNTVLIDGKQFVRSDDAQFEAVGRVNGMPGTWWRMEIREAFNLDNVSMTTDNVSNQSVVLINVDSAEFGDLTTQVSSNPVQIEILNQ